MKLLVIPLLGTALVIAACAAQPPMPAIAPEATLARVTGAAPPEGAPGCYAAIEVKPVQFGTVLRSVEIRPAVIDPATGTELEPAVYQEQEFQTVTDPGEELAFETLCAAELTPGFIAMLQRALKARQLYRGPVNGEMTKATRSAIRAYQAPRGLESEVLARRAAQEMGLLIWTEE